MAIRSIGDHLEAHPMAKSILNACLVAACLAAMPGAARAASILVIESYHAGFDWDQAYVKALNEQLPGHRVETFEMDTKRLPAAHYETKADQAWRRFEEMRPDYVVLGDDNALKYLGKRLGEAKAPTVFLGVNNNPRIYFDDGALPQNMTGVLERPLLNRSVTNIRQLIPNAKRVLILFDDGFTSQSSITSEMKAGNIGGVEVEYRNIGTKQAWEAEVRSARANSFDAIIIGLYQTIKDAEGNSVPADDIMSWTNQHADVPLFAFWSFAVGEGKTIGGTVLDGYEMGTAAAELLKTVMTGQTPYVKVIKEGTPMFSEVELSRWNLTVPERLQSRSVFVR